MDSPPGSPPKSRNCHPYLVGTKRWRILFSLAMAYLLIWPRQKQEEILSCYFVVGWIKVIHWRKRKNEFKYYNRREKKLNGEILQHYSLMLISDMRGSKPTKNINECVGQLFVWELVITYGCGEQRGAQPKYDCPPNPALYVMNYLNLHVHHSSTTLVAVKTFYEILVHWASFGMVCINCDDAAKGDPCIAACGGVIQD